MSGRSAIKFSRGPVTRATWNSLFRISARFLWVVRECDEEYFFKAPLAIWPRADKSSFSSSVDGYAYIRRCQRVSGSVCRRAGCLLAFHDASSVVQNHASGSVEVTVDRQAVSQLLALLWNLQVSSFSSWRRKIKLEVASRQIVIIRFENDTSPAFQCHVKHEFGDLGFAIYRRRHCFLRNMEICCTDAQVEYVGLVWLRFVKRPALRTCALDRATSPFPIVPPSCKSEIVYCLTRVVLPLQIIFSMLR